MVHEQHLNKIYLFIHKYICKRKVIYKTFSKHVLYIDVK